MLNMLSTKTHFNRNGRILKPRPGTFVIPEVSPFFDASPSLGSLPVLFGIFVPAQKSFFKFGGFWGVGESGPSDFPRAVGGRGEWVLHCRRGFPFILAG